MAIGVVAVRRVYVRMVNRRSVIDGLRGGRMAGETIAEGSSNEALITIWLPRRSLSALAGQALLIVAALLVVLGSLGGDLPLLFHGLGISLGLEISVLGANCLNFA